MKNLLDLLMFHLFFVVFLFVVPVCFGDNDAVKWYNECGNNFTCGKVSVGFPFWGGSSRPQRCGYPLFKLSCDDENTTTIEITNMTYYVMEVREDVKVVKLAREDFHVQGVCLQKFVNTSLNYDLFGYSQETQNITVLYGCPAAPQSISYDGSASPPSPGQFPCKIRGTTNSVGLYQTGASGPTGDCLESVVVPIMESWEQSISSSGLGAVIDKGFDVYYKVQDDVMCANCTASNGRCGFNSSISKATCVCADGTYGYEACSGSSISPPPTTGTQSNKTVPIVIGLSFGGLVAGLLVCCVFMLRRKKNVHLKRSKDLPSDLTVLPSINGFHSSQGYTTSPSTHVSRSLPSYSSSKSDLENSSYMANMGVKLFNYSELEEATENFSESRELGDGGFGTVYYGELRDGRVVAVKRLYENSVKRMGQFRNEIEILAHLRHKNLVALYGCTSRRSRDLLLVYEYIPNGTVADHIHGKPAVHLPWSTRLSIAVETAEGLTFLHENDVIHRDVKTSNILLDNNFQVKVADFGLSRLFPTDVTHVSTAPQGTPGYVDPDYYQCYHLTEKSDVYSFGVVLMELISSKVAVDITRHRHDINLANMAVDRIKRQCLQEIVDPKLGFDKDYVVQKMVTLVAELAAKCLQPDKETRPTMKEVYESLKGIQKEMLNAQKQVIVDINQESDDVGLLKDDPPPLSPEK